MFANLTVAVKRRILQELRSFWSLDPNYRDTLVPNIQGRYSFRERPQQAIIVKGDQSYGANDLTINVALTLSTLSDKGALLAASAAALSRI